jgi:RNA polymerase sigma-70 factor (ECF subfamily)
MIPLRRGHLAEFPETNHSLIARVKDLGDGASWLESLGIYQPVVYRVARRRQLQDADA